jgi:hypothetical protein
VLLASDVQEAHQTEELVVISKLRPVVAALVVVLVAEQLAAELAVVAEVVHQKQRDLVQGHRRDCGVICSDQNSVAVGAGWVGFVAGVEVDDWLHCGEDHQKHFLDHSEHLVVQEEGRHHGSQVNLQDCVLHLADAMLLAGG